MYIAHQRPVAHEGFEGGEQINVPVTISWGAKDRLLPPRQAARAVTAIPGARSVMLTGCGHVPTYDDPEQLTQVLLEGSSQSTGVDSPATGRAGSVIHSLHEPG